MKENLTLGQRVGIGTFRYLDSCTYLLPPATAFSEYWGKRPFLFLQVNVSVWDVKNETSVLENVSVCVDYVRNSF